MYSSYICIQSISVALFSRLQIVCAVLSLSTPSPPSSLLSISFPLIYAALAGNRFPSLCNSKIYFQTENKLTFCCCSCLFLALRFALRCNECSLPQIVCLFFFLEFPLTTQPNKNVWLVNFISKLNGEPCKEHCDILYALPLSVRCVGTVYTHAGMHCIR